MSIGGPISYFYQSLMIYRYFLLVGLAMTTIQGRLAALLERSGLKQLDLAKRTAIKQNTLSDLLAGKSKSINGENLAKLCREFCVTPEFIMFGDGDAPDPEVSFAVAEISYILRRIHKGDRDAILKMARAFVSPSDPLIPRPPKDGFTGWEPNARGPKH